MNDNDNGGIGVDVNEKDNFRSKRGVIKIKKPFSKALIRYPKVEREPS
jgi:hypothetical protein